MIDRVKKVIEYKQYSVNSFAEMIGVKQNTLNQQLTGDRKLSLDVIQKIVIHCDDISPEWLLTGSGSMLKKNLENSENLLKQSENDLRISIDELINKKIEKAVMENLDKTITAIMEGMNRNNQQQNEHVEKILKIQSDENAYKFNVIIDAIREIIKDEDKEKFESKIVQLKTKIG